MLTKTAGKLKEHEYLICITQPADGLIVNDKPKMLSIVFDDELYGDKVLSFADAFRIFRLVKNKILPLGKNTDVIVYISCKNGITQSGAIAQWLSEYIDYELVDKEFFKNKDLFIDPSMITINKMFIVQMMYESSLPCVAMKVLEDSTSSQDLKLAGENYLKGLFINELKSLN
jgi:hypothetical protein